MERNKFRQLITKLQSSWIEEKTRKIIILSFLAGAAFIFFLIVYIPVFIASSKSQVKKRESLPSPAANVLPPITPTPTEVIVSAGYSITCQVVVTTSLKKTYFQQLPRCDKPLIYKISPSGKYLAYQLLGASTKVFIYSQSNNIEGLLDQFSFPIVDWQFNKEDNLMVLYGNSTNLEEQFFSYYFIPLLFASYPDNFDLEKNTFTDLAKKKIETQLPNFNKTYAQLMVKEAGVDILSTDKKVLYSAVFSDLEAPLTPTPRGGINRLSLNWAKRIFFFNDGKFQTMDVDGNNILVHQFICDGKEAIPLKSSENFFARSPDGQLLAFIIPEDNQIALYDFVREKCEKTGLTQTANYRENFSFSPDGNYLAFVKNGVLLYVFSKKQTYQLSFHNPKSFANPSAVTGPLVWSGDSRFIYAAISQIENEKPTKTVLKRIYFNKQYEGRQQEIISLPFDSLYAVSPDGEKVVYKKDKIVYIYDVNRAVNTFYQSETADKTIAKLVWLRSGTIVAKNQTFQIDYDGENLVYVDGGEIKVNNFNTKKTGIPLIFFY